MPESVVLDELDHGLVHALALDGRAPFARIGEVLGVSDRTVARRYARLRTAAAVRVAGVLDGRRLGADQWLVRIRSRPGAAMDVAVALARREDTRWVQLVSGGTEITASLQSWTAQERDDLILQRLQRTEAVESVTAHGVLHVFGGGPEPFGAVTTVLDEDQVARLRPVREPAGPVTLGPGDRALVAVLGRDGRAPLAALAAATGWSESTASRRIEALRATGLLYFDVDVPSSRLGFRAHARLWASVPPAQLAATGTAIAAHPEVAFCAATTGPTNLTASVLCRDGADLYRYLTERIGALPLVREVETAPVIRTVKRAGAYEPA